MVNFDCPDCSKRIENVADHHGQTACPFCLQIVSIPQSASEFAELAPPVVEVGEPEPILVAEMVDANPEQHRRTPAEPNDPMELVISPDVDDVETDEEQLEEFSDSELSSSVDWEEVREAEERLRRRRVRKIVMGWFVLAFNLSALVGFTLIGIHMWEVNKAAAYICISGATSTFFFLAVQFWPRRRRRPSRIQEG